MYFPRDLSANCVEVMSICCSERILGMSAGSPKDPILPLLCLRMAIPSVSQGSSLRNVQV
jgi:hypothetical protein